MKKTIPILHLCPFDFNSKSEGVTAIKTVTSTGFYSQNL